ncbi:MAG TPA: saccharopine dehydrogenase NADP-binding domain-containing protein [Thermoleophilaceae bacterium]|nr:saccharopine dehydrogenase NADP-binding domain-containing protein [Thermoleophilaceae bacterium]
MARPIVLFGATGYTGRLVADALIKRGGRPLLAARNEAAVKQLAEELGGLDAAVADVGRPETLRALVDEYTVLVSTVGPFLRWGSTAVDVAVDAGAVYLDSTGEPPFIREVFEQRDAAARSSGATLVTAFGYDFVPGNLAAGLALERAGERAAKVSVGYFLTGGGSPKEAMSGGTASSVAGVMMAPAFHFHNGRVVTERSAKRVRSFNTSGGKQLQGTSIGCSEHLSLPRVYPSLREVDVYLGWFGPASRVMQGVSVLAEVPGVAKGAERLAERFVKGSTGGPGPEARAKSGSLIVAEVEDTTGSVIERVELRGPNGYTFTGEILAWGAMHAAEEGVEGTGALGPVEAFGLRALEAACAEIGLKEENPPVQAQ